MHLIGEYMNRGIECAICSDDPSILGNGGLIYDFWEVYYSQIIDLKAIKKLIINSYMYSGMTQEEYNIKISQWEEEWNRFVEREIVELKRVGPYLFRNTHHGYKPPFLVTTFRTLYKNITHYEIQV